MADQEISRFPYKERARMPGSTTTPGRPDARAGASEHVAFRYTDSVGARDSFSIAAQWLACPFPCRRFADVLTDACARLGADVVCYSFIAEDLHLLLLAGLPAHLCKNSRAFSHDAANSARPGLRMRRPRSRSLNFFSIATRSMSHLGGCMLTSSQPNSRSLAAKIAAVRFVQFGS